MEVLCPKGWQDALPGKRARQTGGMAAFRSRPPGRSRGPSHGRYIMSTKLERAPVEAPAERAAHMSKLTWLQRWTRRMGYAACAWALLFTLEHVYWIFGGSWLLSEAYARGFASLF